MTQIFAPEIRASIDHAGLWCRVKGDWRDEAALIACYGVTFALESNNVA